MLRARAYVRCGAYLAAWVDTAGRPLRVDVVFHPDTVEDFAALLVHSIPDSAATIASVLRTMAATLLPGLSAVSRTRHGRAPVKNPPYSPSEVTRLFAGIEHLASAKRRRHATALLALGIGFGAQPGEANWVGPGHVVALTAELIRVEFRCGPAATPRIVEGSGRYAELLIRVAAEAKTAGETWLLGGGDRRNRSSYLCAELSQAWSIPLSSYRMRNTYLADLAARHDLAGMLDAAGATNMAPFAELLEHIRQARASHRALADVLPGDFSSSDGDATAEFSYLRPW